MKLRKFLSTNILAEAQKQIQKHMPAPIHAPPFDPSPSAGTHAQNRPE
jgi:hypothetical protein